MTQIKLTYYFFLGGERQVNLKSVFKMPLHAHAFQNYKTWYLEKKLQLKLFSKESWQQLLIVIAEPEPRDKLSKLLLGTMAMHSCTLLNSINYLL